MTATTPGDPAVARPAFAAEVQPLILIVDHDRDTIAQLRRVTARQGFRSLAVDDGEDALEVAATAFPHLIILEWALPSVSGIGLCRRLRAQGATRDVPIMMVTGRTGEADKVQGLDAGADDYVTKPFSAEEVGARMRALIRRAGPVAGAGVLRFGEISLDLGRRQVKRNGRPIHLGPTEFRLLHTLLGRPSQVFTREQLLKLAWSASADVEPRTVDVHIRRLRSAMNENGGADLIRTVRCVGYAINPEPG